MRIVVTGAAGHIGSLLARRFAFSFPGSEIILLDNMSNGRYPSLFNLPTTAKYRFFEVDVREADLEPFIRNSDITVHLAAITDAASSFEKADLVRSNNLASTLNVASHCERSGSALILLSSTSVYGTQNSSVSEACAPEDLKPQSPYATVKLEEEKILEDLKTNGSLRAICFRFGTIFGASPGMRFHTAVNKFCWQASMGLPLTVWRTAYEQRRPYLDIMDAVRAIAFVIKENIFDGRVYNVLTGNYTVADIVETIRAYKADVKVNFVDEKIMNQLSYDVSCERFKSLGFVFSGDLFRGIGETMDLLKNNHGFNLVQK